MRPIRSADGVSVGVPQSPASLPGDDNGWHLLQHRQRAAAVTGVDYHSTGVGFFAVWRKFR